MVWFVPSGGAPGNPTFSLSPTIDTTKPVDPVAASNPYSVSKVLGRPIPIVIGTGKVEGIPVIGGALTAQVPTGFTEVPAVNYGGLSSYPPGSQYKNGSYFNSGGIVLVPTYGTQQSTALGYLLAYDPFGDGYDLIRVEINDKVVYDAERGIGASETFRFYGGTQTAVDPITKGVIGAKAGAWQDFAMIFIDGYAASSAPTVKCVISNSADDEGGTQPIAWVGAAPTLDANPTTFHAAYDPAENVIYQILTANDIPGLSSCYLAVLDADTHLERYRIPLEGSDAFVASTSPAALCLRGSGYIWVRLSLQTELNAPVRVYNITTGAIVAEFTEGGGENYIWGIAEQFGSQFLVAGTNNDMSGVIGSGFAVVDLAAGSIGVTKIDTILPASAADIVRGRISQGSASFFALGDDTETISEITFNGDGWTTQTTYTAPSVVAGVHYDPLTEYLLILYGSSPNAHRIAPDTGLIDSFTISGMYSSNFTRYTDRVVPKPGFALFASGTGNTSIWSVDIAGKTATKLADHAAGYPFVDQGKSSYFLFVSHIWVEYRLPSTLPRLVALDTFILTKVMSLAGYGPSELTFEGFSGITGFGFVIASDTNVRTAVQAIADIYSFSFADIGSGFYFKKPGRDDAFAFDATLTTADLVFGDKSAIDSSDEAAIRTTSRVELTYFSKTDYNSRTASFQMPAVNNSIKVDKYSTPLVMSDTEAKTRCVEKYLEAQMRLRDHTYSLMGRPTLLPGDVVSVPSGDIAFGVQIASVALNRDMSVDIQASDFQTSVSTTINPVVNTGYGNAFPVTLATQYIHLDVPLFRYGDDLGGLGLRQYGVVASRGQAGWGGGLLLRGDTVADLTALLSQAPQNGVVGICETILGNPLDPFGTTDTSTVTFRKTVGDKTLLVNQTEAQVLAGANFAFIGAPGRWEGVGYKTAVDNGNGTFTLSGFSIRGYRGTEVFAPLHQVGDQFVMIDASWLKGVSHPLTDLDKTKFYKAIGLTQNPATGTVVPHTIIGAAETPYASVNLTATIVTDGIELGWDYRSRLASGLNPANFGEASLAFQIDILEPTTGGFSVVRTLTSTTGSKLYLNADITTDFGGTPAELTFDVFMMSAVPVLVPGQGPAIAGRGYRARRHVVFTPGAMTADNTIITADSTAYTADAA